MNMELFEQMKVVLSKELDVPDEKLRLDSSLVDDLGADSLDLVQLALEMEERFGVELSERDVIGLKSVGDVVKYVDARIKSGAAPMAAVSQQT
jgi:acyl carrier protein